MDYATLLWIKTWSTLFQGLMTFGFSIQPLFLKRKFQDSDYWKDLIGIANAFSGGLFLAVGIIDILPEAVVILYEYRKENFESEMGFPWPFFAAIVTFSLILALNKIMYIKEEDDENSRIEGKKANNFIEVKLVLDDDKNKRGKELEILNKVLKVNFSGNNRVEPGVNQSQESSNIFILKVSRDSFMLNGKKTDDEPIEQSMIQKTQSIDKSLEISDKTKMLTSNVDKKNSKKRSNKNDESKNKSKKKKGATVQERSIESKENSIDDNNLTFTGACKLLNQNAIKDNEITKKNEQDSLELNKAIRNSINSNDLKAPLSTQYQSLDHNIEPSPTNATGYILFIAFGIHALSEGLAIGLTKTFNDWLGIFIAIFAHKWAEALSLGISFLKEIDVYGWKNRVYCLIIFSLSTPIGVLLGVFLMSVNKLYQSVFLGIAAGTFIYIACSEIIVEEFMETKNVVKKFFAYVLGSFFIIGIYFLEQEL